MFNSIPHSIRSIKAWLVWRLIQKPQEKKPSKVPFYASGALRGKPSGENGPDAPMGSDLDVAHLVTFDEAVAAMQSGGYSGIGLAILPGAGLVALDFDGCITNDKLDPRVAALVQGTYAEISPSGTGVRALYRGYLPSRKDTKGDPAVEVFGTSGFVTITGNVLPDHSLWGWEELIEVPDAVRSMYEQRFGSAFDSIEGNALASVQPVMGWTLEQGKAYLFDCDPSTDRDHWLRALAAMHHEFNGSDEALNICDEWSKLGDNYGGRADVEGRWRSFGRNASAPITGRWLLKWREECLARSRYRCVSDWKQKLLECSDEFTLRESVCKDISKDARLTDMDREAIAQALFDRLKSMGTKYPIAQCRKLIAPPRSHVAVQREVPEWLDGFVYVTELDKFYKVDSDEPLTMQSFNAKYNRFIPVDDDGAIVKSASWMALEDYQIETVVRGVYLPWAGPVFDMSGVKYVNTFRPSSVPKAVESLSTLGKDAIAMFLRHLKLLSGSRDEIVRTWVDWMAFCVQNPGKKARWAPVIKGIEGDGKTLIGSVMSAVMGRANVKQISPKVLGTDFTDWAHGACVGVLEEIKLTGHNRYDILNGLKPYITNDEVPIHPKGQAERNVINTMNYIAFTNHSDALPLSDNDRRFFIVFTPFGSEEEMNVAIRDIAGVGPGAYFDSLYGAIASQGSELRRWLLDHQISESFKPNGRAPATTEKQLMVAMSASPEEEAIRDAITAGSVGVTDTVLSSSCLSEAIATSGVEVPQTSALNRLLAKMGWVKVPKKVKWRGRAHTVWVRGQSSLDNDVLREILEKTDFEVAGSKSALDLFT